MILEIYAFCCECLVYWAKTCSDDQSIVICPLCKKVYQIPHEGVYGFPAHFLGTNLRETVDVERKKTSLTQYCEKHDGEIKKYFCQICCCATCSDCGLLDPAHKGHKFIRLEAAAKKQSDSLQNLFKKGREVQQKYVIALQQTELVVRSLNRAATAATNAVDRAENTVIKQLKDLVRNHKQEIENRKREQARELDQIQKNLQVKLTSIQSAIEQGTKVVNSTSECEIISFYPTLSANLQQLIQSQPIAADSKIGYLKFEPAKVQITSIGRVSCEEQNTVNKSGVGNRKSAAAVTLSSPSSKQSSPSAISSFPAAAASLGSIFFNSTASVLRKRSLPSSISSNSTVKRSSPSAISSIRDVAVALHQQNNIRSVQQQLRGTASTYPAVSYDVLCNSHQRKPFPAKNKPRKQWIKCRTMETSPQTQCPHCIAIHPTGDVAVTSDVTPVTVFSRNGNVKYVLKDSTRGAWDIAITPSNQYIIPGKNDFHIYNEQGIHLSTTPTFDVNNRPSKPYSVAVDSKGRIIVGLGLGNFLMEHKTVSIHQPDGTLISKFTTSETPRTIACTPDDKLVVSFSDNTLQMMDQSGHNARIIQPPAGSTSWRPKYMCGSKQGELYVGNWGYPKHAVYRYVATGGEYKYVDCIATTRSGGIALSANEDELFVVNETDDNILIFQSSEVW